MMEKSGDHQLRLVVYPIIYRVSYIPGGDRRISEPSTVVLKSVVLWSFKSCDQSLKWVCRPQNLFGDENSLFSCSKFHLLIIFWGQKKRFSCLEAFQQKDPLKLQQRFEPLRSLSSGPARRTWLDHQKIPIVGTKFFPSELLICFG